MHVRVFAERILQARHLAEMEKKIVGAASIRQHSIRLALEPQRIVDGKIPVHVGKDIHFKNVATQMLVIQITRLAKMIQTIRVPKN